MSSIGSVPASLVPLPQSATATARLASAEAETTRDVLDRGLAELGIGPSSVGLVGLAIPSAPGDVAILLAAATLSLEKTNDEAQATRARISLAAVAQALRSFDPLAAQTQMLDEQASLATASETRQSVDDGARTIRSAIAADEAALAGVQSQIGKASGDLAAAEAAIAALEKQPGYQDKPEYRAALAAKGEAQGRLDVLRPQAAAYERSIASGKRELVDLAASTLGATAGLLAAEAARLPESSDRAKAASADAKTSTPGADLAKASGDDAYRLASAALDDQSTLLAAKVAEFDAAAKAAADALRAGSLALIATVARVSAFVAGAAASGEAARSGRAAQIDALLGDIFEASRRSDKAAALGAASVDDASDEAKAEQLQRLAEAILGALSDIARTVADLDPLEVRRPDVEPGRSRVRLDA